MAIYLERLEIYDDFQDVDSFVHGHYIIESIRLFIPEGSLEAEIQKLEEDLWSPGEKSSS